MNYEEYTVKESVQTIPVFDENFESIKIELEAVSKRLLELLPDPSIGPEERIERIARIVPSSLMNSTYRKTARTKLSYIRNRLNELVPGQELTTLEKINYLVDLIEKKVPNYNTLFERLELMGDKRTSDIGR